jgi:hypothetical protein
VKSDPRYAGQTKEFWAHVRTISQSVGYTQRQTKMIKVPKADEVVAAFRTLSLSTDQIISVDGLLSPFGKDLLDYFDYRARVLNGEVRNNLMDKSEAQKEFERLKRELSPRCSLPMNKQTGEKKNHAFLTGIVNMLIEQGVGDAPCNYDPRGLTTVTGGGKPVRTLSRRVDGAFPAVVNPIAIWEIKEYYYTTTFGSRVADGVYETLLDGMELEELERSSHRKIEHILFVDDRFTWWESGRSYLCRIIDMLHMGYVDEVMFGREVLAELPKAVERWRRKYDAMLATAHT